MGCASSKREIKGNFLLIQTLPYTYAPKVKNKLKFRRLKNSLSLISEVKHNLEFSDESNEY